MMQARCALVVFRLAWLLRLAPLLPFAASHGDHSHGDHHHHPADHHHGHSHAPGEAPEVPTLGPEAEATVQWSVSPRRLSAVTDGERDGLPEEMEAQLHSEGIRMQLRLRRNRALLPRSFRHVIWEPSGISEGTMPRPCLYQGEVVGDPQGSVGISVCDGHMNGIVVSRGKVLSVEPIRAADGGEGGEAVTRHRVRRLHAEDMLHFLPKPVLDQLNNSNNAAPRNLGDDKARRLQSTKYVEAYVVNDNKRYKNFNQDEATMATQSVAVMNAVTALYRATLDSGAFPHVIQVVLVGMMTLKVDPDSWDGASGLYQGGETNQDVLLQEFSDWSVQMRQKASGGMPANDNQVLLSGHDFLGSVLGLAYVSGMCMNDQSCSINTCLSSDTTAYCAAIVAHEMGHNFGMQHDSSGNNCPQSGFVMNAALGAIPTKFSTCSDDYITTYFDSTYQGNGACLDNTPTQVWGDPQCQNGFVEDGEECDCGQADCSSLDPCCNGATCQFASASYQCSNTAGECCESCMFVSAASNKVCRAARDSCDMAETCSGTSVQCPTDAFFYPGSQCTFSNGGTSFTGRCYAGSCRSLESICAVDINRDYKPSGCSSTAVGGCYDQNSMCKVFNDDCGLLVCHEASGATEDCFLGFENHGQSTKVPEGAPCWYPSHVYESRMGQCYKGSCRQPHVLAETPVCGNGGIDYGEECDCGTATTDTCCDCATCKLKAGKQCAAGEACCKSDCMYETAGTVCRASIGECDEQEVCSGSSSVCPADAGKQVGTACGGSGTSASTCYAKTCIKSQSQQCVDGFWASQYVIELEQIQSVSSAAYNFFKNSAGSSTCTRLICCTDGSSSTQCVTNEESRTFPAGDPNAKTVYKGAPIDGSMVTGNQICFGGSGYTAATSCASGKYLEVSTGRCVDCDPSCTACSGPTQYDCTGSCKHGTADSRGACPVSTDQVAAAQPATTTLGTTTTNTDATTTVITTTVTTTTNTDPTTTSTTTTVTTTTNTDPTTTSTTDPAAATTTTEGQATIGGSLTIDLNAGDSTPADFITCQTCIAAVKNAIAALADVLAAWITNLLMQVVGGGRRLRELEVSAEVRQLASGTVLAEYTITLPAEEAETKKSNIESKSLAQVTQQLATSLTNEGLSSNYTAQATASSVAVTYNPRASTSHARQGALGCSLVAVILAGLSLRAAL